MILSFLRAVLLYIVILSAVRLMGKRQISELQTSELVVTLLISDLAAVPMQNTGQPLVSGLIPIAVLVMCEIAASVFMLKSGKFRRLVCGKPVVLINNGKVDQKEMARLRLSVEDLFEELREKDVFSIGDVAWAIMETNGKLSVVKKPEKDSPLPTSFWASPRGIPAWKWWSSATGNSRIFPSPCAAKAGNGYRESCKAGGFPPKRYSS